MSSKCFDILDADDIKKLTGQYDLECVKRLKFVGTDQRKIKTVSDIEQCTNLTALILTNHNVSHIVLTQIALFEINFSKIFTCSEMFLDIKYVLH